MIDDTWDMIESLNGYTVDVYAHILRFFKGLKHLTIIEPFDLSYPCLILRSLPSTVFRSSTLTHLCIDVHGLDDCLCLLDGRLKQLSTLIIRIDFIIHSSSIKRHTVGFNK